MVRAKIKGVIFLLSLLLLNLANNAALAQTTASSTDTTSLPSTTKESVVTTAVPIPTTKAADPTTQAPIFRAAPIGTAALTTQSQEVSTTLLPRSENVTTATSPLGNNTLYNATTLDLSNSSNITTSSNISAINGTDFSAILTTLASPGASANKSLDSTTPVPTASDSGRDVMLTDREMWQYFVAILIIVIIVFVFVCIVLIVVIATRSGGGNQMEHFPLEERHDGEVSGEASGISPRPVIEHHAPPPPHRDMSTSPHRPVSAMATPPVPERTSPPMRSSYPTAAQSPRSSFPPSPTLQPPPTAVRQEFPMAAMGHDVNHDEDADDEIGGDLESASIETDHSASSTDRDSIHLNRVSAEVGTRGSGRGVNTDRHHVSA